MKNKKNKKDKEKIINSINSILSENFLLTLSTIKENKPYSCTAFYAYDKNFNLYIWSENSSDHIKNIIKNSSISVNIVNFTQKFGSELKGLQIQGTGKIISGIDLIKGGALYIKRFPKVFKYIKNPSDFNSKKLKSTLCKIEINKIKLLDERTFGKEEYRTISIR